MTREEFSDLVYDELCDDSDNCRANRIIDAADDYAYDASHPYAFCGTTPTIMKEMLIAKESGDMSKWISVKERLPASDGRYLVSIRGANGIYVGISYYSKALSSKWIFHNRIYV